MQIIGPGALQDAGRMSAQAFDSSPWRAVTALTLHVDVEHAVANAATALGCTLLLSRRTGLGVSIAVAVVGGALGNVLDAYACAPEVTWVGASTAVFALMGALCVAYRSVAMVLLSAALCYASHAADVHTSVHVCGWFAGVVVGLLADREHKFSPLAQLACAFGAASLVAVSWSAALA
jgi:rhomboid protease GluP